MFTTVRHEWYIALPESMIRGIGAEEGSKLECITESGEIRLRLSSITGEKNFFC